MKVVIVRLEICLDCSYLVASNSLTNKDVPELMQDLHIDVDHVVLDAGFIRTSDLSDRPSRRNGGWAYYDNYLLESDDRAVKLLINVRTANHGSKPDLATKNSNRVAALNDTADTITSNPNTPIEVVDTYYTEREWGAQYYIGKGDNYSDPVDSLEKLNIMLKGQLTKLIQKYS